jgi:adenylylsulfate kinase-like enzyme
MGVSGDTTGVAQHVQRSLQERKLHTVQLDGYQLYAVPVHGTTLDTSWSRALIC